MQNTEPDNTNVAVVEDASDESSEHETPELTQAEENNEFTKIQVVFEGKLCNVQLHTIKDLDKLLKSKIPDDNSDAALGETDTERAALDSLINVMSDRFNDCGAKMRELLAGELTTLEKEINQKYAENENMLIMVRAATRVTGGPDTQATEEKEEPVKEEPAKEEPVKEEPAKEEPAKEEPAKEEPAQEEPAKEEPVQLQISGWDKIDLFDMTEKKVASHYDKDFIAQFAQMMPRKTGVRLLVLETPVITNDVVATMRFCAYYVHHQRTLENADPNKKIVQRKRPANSLDLLHSFFGHTLLQTKKPTDDNTSLAESTTRKLDLIKAAQMELLKRRQRMRERLLERQMPILGNFTLNWFQEALVKRWDEAAPHLPLRLYIRLHVERNGLIVDMDSSVVADENDVKKRLLDAEAELVEIDTRINSIVKHDAQADKKSGKPNKKARFKAEAVRQVEALREQHFQAANMAKKCRHIAKVIKRCDPATQIFLYVVDTGTHQDKGVNIETYMLLEVPIDEMRAAEAERAKNKPL